MSAYQIITNKSISKSFISYIHAQYDDAFTKDELKKIIQLSNELPLDAGTTSSQDESIIPTRVSKINFQTPNNKNQWIFDKLNSLIVHANSEFFGYDLTGYEYYQYAEYDEKDAGHYDYHTDIMLNGDNINGGVQELETRKLSISILLNEPGVDFEGGEFYIKQSNDDAVVKIKAGSAFLFSSFLLHKVAPVTKGNRKSLVIWVRGPKFK
jgi:PKHD-type hydroxylase